MKQDTKEKKGYVASGKKQITVEELQSRGSTRVPLGFINGRKFKG